MKISKTLDDELHAKLILLIIHEPLLRISNDTGLRQCCLYNNVFNFFFWLSFVFPLSLAKKCSWQICLLMIYLSTRATSEKRDLLSVTSNDTQSPSVSGPNWIMFKLIISKLIMSKLMKGRWRWLESCNIVYNDFTQLSITSRRQNVVKKQYLRHTFWSRRYSIGYLKEKRGNGSG